MEYSINISDGKGRSLLKVKGDRVLVARFPDMTEKMKLVVSDFFSEFTGEDVNVIKGFLDYENDEFDFCS